MYLVTGCAGFIGSSLVRKLLIKKKKVIGIDNLSTGNRKNMNSFLKDKNFFFFKRDIKKLDSIKKLFKNVKVVFHLSANADVRFGPQNLDLDLKENTLGTFNVLESMRLNSVKEILFSSTGSIYGETNVIPTPENCPFPVQTSLYASSKLACESLIQSYCEYFDFKSWIFRFVSILGPGYSHGHVYDFYKQLKRDCKKLKVLGDGYQTKSYLHVDDCLDAIFLAYKKSKSKINIFNLGTDETVTVRESINVITNYLGFNPKCIYGKSNRGWAGDNPLIYLDTKKIRSLGWKNKFTIKESLEHTLQYLIDNQWILKKEKLVS